jgi:hypothetical protein
MATTRLDRKGFLKSIGVATAALLARPAAASAGVLRTTEAKTEAETLTARKAPQTMAWRTDRR